MNDELRLVASLTGVNETEIKFSDEGFLSRGYVIDNGRIVFKFKKNPEVSYKNEVRILEYINSLSFSINLQRVGWTSENDSYLGLYGVKGESLEQTELSDEKRINYGQQIGLFLKNLHSTEFNEAGKFELDAEISAWQKRFKKSKALLLMYFNEAEIEKMNEFIMSEAPEELRTFGEKLVFSHGDLGMGNIFVDENDKVGIIDFSESVYLDEAADFMDIEDDGLCEEILNTYSADEILRKKVKIRRDVRPMFVIGTYANRSEKEKQRFVERIRYWLS